MTRWTTSSWPWMGGWLGDGRKEGSERWQGQGFIDRVIGFDRPLGQFRVRGYGSRHGSRRGVESLTPDNGAPTGRPVVGVRNSPDSPSQAKRQPTGPPCFSTNIGFGVLDSRSQPALSVGAKLPSVHISDPSRQPHLLTLPLELRDQIYREYLFIDAEYGYVFDFAAGKLRAARSPPVDELGNVCTDNQQIAHEIRGLALRLHTITSTTLYSDELRTRAGRWHFLLMADYGYAARLSHRFSTTSVAQGLKSYTSLVGGSKSAWGETPSVHREIMRQIYNLAIADPDIHDYFASSYWQRKRGNDEIPVHKLRYDPALIFDFDKEPWRIPTEEELDHLAAELPQRTWANNKASIRSRYDAKGFSRSDLTTRVSEWMSEASAPGLKSCASRFGLEACLRQAEPKHLFKKKGESFYYQTIFPDIIAGVVRKSRIIAEEYYGLGHSSWGHHLLATQRDQKRYDIVPPMPPLTALVEETLIRPLGNPPILTGIAPAYGPSHEFSFHRRSQTNTVTGNPSRVIAQNP
ncbi:hypothetical protein B0H66DRAFT_537853 [Apodospora peruviana]|uniref:Uncharacterized protein n=1 Tax=Apodospora peruviana TaxID=516989 RepID=A0AAE0HVL3_9PEZI|nr:hypothetical protein B0H66DRAFT_537853 [Apodospora peruviana]